MELNELIALSKALKEDAKRLSAGQYFSGIFFLKQSFERKIASNQASEEEAQFVYDVESYEGGCGALLSHEIIADKLEKDALPVLLEFYVELAHDHNQEEDVMLYQHAAYYKKAHDEGLFDYRQEAVYLECLLIFFMKTHYEWRGKPYAASLRKVLQEHPGDYPLEFVTRLVNYYRSVLAPCDAYEVALENSEAYLKQGEQKKAAMLYAYAGGIAQDIPGVELLDEEELANKFGSHAGIAAAYSAHATFRHDPIEASKEFQDAYDTVMEEVMARIELEKAPYICHLLWGYMEEAFYIRGIQWKSPATMNPTVMFD